MDEGAPNTTIGFGRSGEHDMNLISALLGATKRGGTTSPDVHNRLLRQEIDKQLVEYEAKLDDQIRDQLAKMTDKPASERAKKEAFLAGKKAEGMQKLRDAAEAQYTKNCRA
jgi:hypothetical protein